MASGPMPGSGPCRELWSVSGTLRQGFRSLAKGCRVSTTRCFLLPAPAGGEAQRLSPEGGGEAGAVQGSQESGRGSSRGIFGVRRTDSWERRVDGKGDSRHVPGPISQAGGRRDGLEPVTVVMRVLQHLGTPSRG